MMRTPQFWSTDGWRSDLLLPASLLYRAGNWLTRVMANPRPPAIPTIAIGNVTAGGAGKTPTALAVTALLRTLGFVPHCITRGYGGHSRQHASQRVREGDDWQETGDEALLLAALAPTWRDRDRLRAIATAATAGATIAVCDDGLQHYALQPTLSLLVIDGPAGLGNGRLLPAGPLREPLSAALACCTAALVIGEDRHGLLPRLSPQLPVFEAHLAPQASLPAGPLVAFAGLGRPEKFFATLQAMGATLAATRLFPDHHHYRDAELAALQALAQRHQATLVTTAKDAVKLPPAFRASCAVLPVSLRLTQEAAFREFLRTRLPYPT